MDFLFGLKCKDFVLLAADESKVTSIIKLRKDYDKSYQLGSKMLMLCVGEDADADQFANYIAKNVKLYEMRNGYEMTPKAAAAFTRHTICNSLRSSEPYFVHCIIGGVDDLVGGGYLTYIDYLGTQFDGPYLMHGYGGHFCYSILDSVYKPDMSKEQALDALKKCLTEINKRCVVSSSQYRVYVIDKEGLHRSENIQNIELTTEIAK